MTLLLLLLSPRALKLRINDTHAHEPLAKKQKNLQAQAAPPLNYCWHHAWMLQKQQQQRIQRWLNHKEALPSDQNIMQFLNTSPRCLRKTDLGQHDHRYRTWARSNMHPRCASPPSAMLHQRWGLEQSSLATAPKKNSRGVYKRVTIQGLENINFVTSTSRVPFGLPSQTPPPEHLAPRATMQPTHPNTDTSYDMHPYMTCIRSLAASK